MKEQKIIHCAKSSMKALRNEYKTVIAVDHTAFDKVCDRIQAGSEACYIGIKNTPVIDTTIINKLESAGFVRHTTDVMSDNGRAVHRDLLNPVTLKPMTGSSGGTAINVFTGINELGVGTDGGGSVLCPALSLNLYGFITKLIEISESYRKKSTDDITFVPAVGFLSAKLSLIKKAFVSQVGELSTCEERIKVAIPHHGCLNTPDGEDVYQRIKDFLAGISGIDIEEIPFPDVYGDRNIGIEFLKQQLKHYDLVVSYEGPIDYFGMGDSLFGQMDEMTKKSQYLSGKGLSRVVNMVEGSALTIPDHRLSSGFILISKSEINALEKLFHLALQVEQYEASLLTKRYFVE